MHNKQYTCIFTDLSCCQQPLSQRGPFVADPGSASGASFQCMKFLSFFSYLSYLGHTSLLGLQQRPEDRATLLLSTRWSPITRKYSWALQWTLLCMYAIRKHLKKYLTQKVAHIGSPIKTGEKSEFQYNHVVFFLVLLNNLSSTW